VVQRDETDTLTVPVYLAGSPMRLGISWREDAGEPGTLILSRVVPGSAAHLAGLRVTDRIYQVAEQDFQDGNHFLQILSTLPGSIDFLVEREGRLQTVTVDLPSVF
jgi:S1-C subfamily serine protease